MIGCLRTRVRNQPIIALYFESENELKLYNLEARCKITSFISHYVCLITTRLNWSVKMCTLLLCELLSVLYCCLLQFVIVPMLCNIVDGRESLLPSLYTVPHLHCLTLIAQPDLSTVAEIAILSKLLLPIPASLCVSFSKRYHFP